MSENSESSNVDNASAPSLHELKTRQCSLPELQASIVKVIELHNAQNGALQERLPSRRDVIANSRYGL